MRLMPHNNMKTYVKKLLYVSNKIIHYWGKRNIERRNYSGGSDCYIMASYASGVTSLLKLVFTPAECKSSICWWFYSCWRSQRNQRIFGCLAVPSSNIWLLSKMLKNYILLLKNQHVNLYFNIQIYKSQWMVKHV